MGSLYSIMKPTEQAHFDDLYTRHLRALKLRGMSEATIDSYQQHANQVLCVMKKMREDFAIA